MEQGEAYNRLEIIMKSQMKRELEESIKTRSSALIMEGMGEKEREPEKPGIQKMMWL